MPLKNRFKEFLHSFTTRDKPPQQLGSTYFYPLALASELFGGNNFAKDFIEVPEVNAVLNIKARAEASGISEVVSKTTDEPVKNYDQLVNIFKHPNWFQGQQEFWKQSSLFRSINGNEVLYFLKPVGMPNSYKGMFTLDPANIEIRYPHKETYFQQATNEGIEYIYKVNNKEIKLDLENIIHLNDNRIGGDNLLKGTSKLESLQPAIQNIRAAYTKRNIALRMPIGVMSNQGSRDTLGTVAPMDGDEKKKVNDRIMTRGAYPILTNLSLAYDAMNINAKTMGLFEETREAVGCLCDAFGVPYSLLANIEKSGLGSKGTEMKEAKRQLYEESVIPDMQEKFNAINNYLETNKKSYEVRISFDHLPVFSEDVKERATSLKMLVDALDKAYLQQIITKEQYQAELLKFGI